MCHLPVILSHRALCELIRRLRIWKTKSSNEVYWKRTLSASFLGFRSGALLSVQAFEYVHVKTAVHDNVGATTS